MSSVASLVLEAAEGKKKALVEYTKSRRIKELESEVARPAATNS